MSAWWVLPVTVGMALLLARPLAGYLAQLVLWLSSAERPGAVTTGAEGMLGREGVARSALEPRGKVFVRGELWNAVAEDRVAAQQEIEVVAVEGLTLRVRPRPPIAEPVPKEGLS